MNLPGFPAEYKMGPLATGEALNLLRKERGLDWGFRPHSASGMITKRDYALISE